MPPKRRGEKPRSAALAPKDPPRQPPVPVSAPIPPPPPVPQPPPPPPETGATKVRREWSKFVGAWYEPQKRKLLEKLQKDILVKYKSLGSAKETQKLREMELFEKLDSIAEQLTQPARVEWERRLELAHLREDQWDDMTGEEQQAVLSVFVGFFTDDVEHMDDDDLSAEPSSTEEDSIAEEPPYRGMPSYAPPALSRQPIPPTPTRQTFEFVNPTSFFVDSMTPPNPTKNLPALSMDHLATLGPSNAARSAELVSASVSGISGFHNWASEAGIVSQPQPAKPPAASTPSAQSLSARPRATDNMSRQASAASTSYSPPLKSSSPQYSPQNQTTKFSPPINADYLPPGKRYIGPVILEEEPDPIEQVLLKSKMADEYQQYKISLRIQMIYQFHAEAADVEIKLFESLLAGEGTKESRARAVQEHETIMMRLREQKEEERKRLCAEEREKRREEMRQHLAQRRSTQNREVDSGPSKSFPDKTSVQQRPGKATHQKENVPLSRPAVASSSKLEAPSVIKKSNSSLSQDEASANEVLFANAMAMMTQGKAGAGILTSAQASLNEALFANAAAALSAHGQPGTTTVQPPNIMRKSNSSRSQEYDVPQITVSFADPPTSATPEPAQAPPATAKGKKGKKGQPTAQIPLARSVAITEEPEVEMGAELPLPPSLWSAATVTAKSVWGGPSASLSTSTAKLTIVGAVNTNAKKPTPSSKKGKKVTIIEEPDVDADPIVSPPKTKAVKGAWGSVSGKSKVTPLVAKESELEPPPPPPSRGKKAAEAVAKSSQKPQLKVAILEEHESEFEPSPAPARASKAKSMWEVPAATTSTQSAKKTTQQQAVPRHGASSSGSKSGRVDTVPDPEDQWPEMVAGESTMPENINYWAKFMAGQPEAEAETQAPPPTEETGKHVRWTPAISEDSDGEETGEVDEELATNMWMQYAISGGDIPALGGAPEESRVMPSGIVQHDTSLWEQGTGNKKLNPTTGDLGNRAQQTSVFDRAALTGQWPKMDSWLSPPSRGQNSSSTRVF
ncbi:hypothetical protein JVT61DRAFT_10279 [Boletus reticuloceps]|uniref:Uncharacterized protein n=1 Tax=Boletus reticuloceps TaxID=495285 RepID=A0A8I2YUY0_9AGAM|nr:hypothetical protein JVT61DRAFT_10279 [Boletus reticuloceps]